MAKLIVVNQVVGPFYVEFLKELKKSNIFDSIDILTGTKDETIISNLEEIGVCYKKLISYDNRNIFRRILTWSIFSVQTLLGIVLLNLKKVISDILF